MKRIKFLHTEKNPSFLVKRGLGWMEEKTFPTLKDLINLLPVNKSLSQGAYLPIRMG